MSEMREIFQKTFKYTELQDVIEGEQIVQQIKTRRAQMQAQNFQNGAPSGAGGALSPDQNARMTRLEQKLDKLINHLGVK